MYVYCVALASISFFNGVYVSTLNNSFIISPIADLSAPESFLLVEGHVVEVVMTSSCRSRCRRLNPVLRHERLYPGDEPGRVKDENHVVQVVVSQRAEVAATREPEKTGKKDGEKELPSSLSLSFSLSVTWIVRPRIPIS